MEIIRTDYGFTEELEHPFIHKIECVFPERCVINFCDGSSNSFYMKSDIYNRLYGIPASKDGALIFKSEWDNGIYAVSTKNGEIIWHFKKKRITRIFVYQTYIVALQQNKAVIKIDVLSGKELAEIKSPSIEDAFQLFEPYVLVDRIKGYLCILDTNSMIVTKRYHKATYNPEACLSVVIKDAYVKDGLVYIEGFEEYPNNSYQMFSQKTFDRALGQADY